MLQPVFIYINNTYCHDWAAFSSLQFKPKFRFLKKEGIIEKILMSAASMSRRRQQPILGYISNIDGKNNLSFRGLIDFLPNQDRLKSYMRLLMAAGPSKIGYKNPQRGQFKYPVNQLLKPNIFLPFLLPLITEKQRSQWWLYEEMLNSCQLKLSKS